MKYIFPITLFFLSSKKANAHVRYIAETNDVAGGQDAGVSYLLSSVTDATFVLLVLATLLFVVLIYRILAHIPAFRNWCGYIKRLMPTYEEFVPWIARLSLGIALLGASISEVFVSPVLAASSLVATFEMVLGFLLLAGLFVVPAAVGVLLLYLVAVATDPYLLGALDVGILAIILIVLDGRRPGLDEILTIPGFEISWLKSTLPMLARIGMGGALLYLAIVEKFLNPKLAAHVVEITNLTQVIPVAPEIWVLGVGFVELILGILLLLGLKTRAVAAATFCVLVLSFFYFGESVTAHITFFGILSIIFIYGGGQGSLDHHMRRNHPLEL